MSNPLLEHHELPPFSAIKPEHVEPAISEILSESRRDIEQLLAQNPDRWETLVLPLDAIGDRLSQAWSPVGHLNAVANTDELRAAYNACLPKLSEYGTWIGQNHDLYMAFKRLAESAHYQTLTPAQQKVIDNNLRDFKLSGVALEPEQKRRYGALKKRLSELTSKFSENVLDATQAWSKLIVEEAELEGVPESTLALFKHNAEAKAQQGWLINLEFPSYFPVMSYCDNRALRQEVYTAYCTRASDQGPYAGQFDNGPLMSEILELRKELAELMGFASYAERSLATKMAESPQQVFAFLTDLAAQSKPVAAQELEELRHFARSHYGIEQLEPWDLTYYGEKLRQHRYAISQETLRPYFPAAKVINGMFQVTEKLYGVQFAEVEAFDSYHADLKLFDVVRDGARIARFYLDLYAREGKRGGAWMDDCRARWLQPDGTLQLPVAYLTCNFSKPVGGKPALLTHDEVTTLFHEFGHGLHHMLTRQSELDISGINGVAWDAVELPSQFMENFCWEPEALALISGHYETGAPLPQELLDKMLAAKNFHSGLMMLRQLEFALFDFRLHHEFVPGLDIQAVLDQVRAEVAVSIPPAFNRFQHSFSHIFAGGYAAGYYSYKWAEVLSADAFSLFEENGIFDPATGQSFLDNILAMGGSEEPMALFKAFRGREPKIDALLRHSGISVD